MNEIRNTAISDDDSIQVHKNKATNNDDCQNQGLLVSAEALLHLQNTFIQLGVATEEENGSLSRFGTKMNTNSRSFSFIWKQSACDPQHAQCMQTRTYFLFLVTVTTHAHIHT